VLRLVPEARRDAVRRALAPMIERLRRFADLQRGRVDNVAERRDPEAAKNHRETQAIWHAAVG